MLHQFILNSVKGTLIVSKNQLRNRSTLRLLTSISSIRQNIIYSTWKKDVSLHNCFTYNNAALPLIHVIARSTKASVTDDPNAVKTSDVANGVKQHTRPASSVSHYLKLSKARLSGLVVLTAMAGYAAAPGAFYCLPFAGVAVGTALCSASANSFNQFLEIPYDSQMARTRNRVLVQGHVRPLDAIIFGTVSATTGVAILFSLTNGLTALLGALNIALYAGVYTPSKRMSIINTWLGSAVGAIPPLMGWAAATGTIDPAAMLLALVLYCWQFPHFNALSWNYRQDYSRAGYRMMAVTDPALCRRVALRHTLALIPICLLLPLTDATTWWLAIETLPLNGYFAWLAWRFYQRSDNKSARDLFRFSLIHLPLLMLLILINKKSDTRTLADIQTGSFVNKHPETSITN